MIGVLTSSFVSAQYNFVSKEIRSAQTNIDSFFGKILTREEKKEIINDPIKLKERISIPENQLLDQVLLSVFKSKSEVEYSLRKQAWITLAKNSPSEAAISSSEILSSVDEGIRVKTLVGIMEAVDAPESFSGRSWDFSHYLPIFELTKDKPFERLLLYTYQKSPGDALMQMLCVYGDDLSKVEKKNITDKTDRISNNLRKGDLGDREMDVDDVVEFFLELKEYDKWYFDLFIAVCLEKDRLRNISPKLNEYFESKPDSLANKLRQDGGIASLPPQKISLESLKNEQGKERENRLRGNNPDNLGKREISSRSDEKSQRQEEIAELKKSSLPWIIAGVLLVGILFLVLKTFKSKSTS